MATGWGWLGAAAGASTGLQKVLEQRLAEAQFAEAQRRAQAQEAETQRAARAREAQATRELGEQTAFRQLQQQQLEQERLRDEAFRQQQLGQQRELSQGQLAQARSIQGMLEAGRNERATQAASDREALARLTANLRPAPTEPLYPVAGPNGEAIYVPRSQAAGQVRAATAAERDAGQSYADIHNVLNQIKANYDPSFVGPLQNRARSTAQLFGVANPKYAAFKQGITALQNATTRLAFSSRASDQDVARAIAEGVNPNVSEADFVRQLQGIEQRLGVREHAFRQATGMK